MNRAEALGDMDHLVSDRRLVQRMARGEAGALRTLYCRHRRTVYALAYAVLVDATDAEEVVAETFDYAWSTADRFGREDTSVHSWLTGIARSRARGVLLSRERLHVASR